MQFEDFKEFESWKAEEEVNTKAEYILKGAPYTGDNKKIWYYYCSRAGSYAPRGDKKTTVKITRYK